MCRQWLPRPEEYVLQLLRRLLCMSAGQHMERCSIRQPRLRYGLQIGSGYVQNRRLYGMSNDGFESCLCCNIVGQYRFIPIPITRMSLAKRCFVKAKTIIGCNLLKIATDDCFYKSKIDRPQKLL